MKWNKESPFFCSIGSVLLHQSCAWCDPGGMHDRMKTGVCWEMPLQDQCSDKTLHWDSFIKIIPQIKVILITPFNRQFNRLV
uniref:Uncharacterized protein n=1 Tax=Anguilla anguilla TaxID=7936 RepID=A0A0E9X4Y4_ANGAN